MSKREPPRPAKSGTPESPEENGSILPEKPPQPAAAASVRPRDHALSPAHLARIFHQPGVIYFGAVAECLSIREAARRLNVASSAVTRQVTQLEDALGLALFQRETRRLALTPAGEILYRQVRRLTAPLEAAVAELDMLRGLKAGSVRIASVESVGLSFLPELLVAFTRAHPRLSVDVRICASAEIQSLLVEDQVDIGLGFVTRPPPLVEVAVRRDVRIGVLMRPDHPFAAEARFTLASCMAHPLAVARPELSIREVIEPFLQRASPFAPPLVEVDSIRMLVELARLGRHVSIMTPIGAQNELRDGDLVFRPLEDYGLPANRFGLMVRAGHSLSFAPAAFYEHAKRYFHEVPLPGAL